MTLEIDNSYKIIGFKKSCPYKCLQQLLSFGFFPKAIFKIIKKAPLGNPYQIMIQNISICIRENELDMMQVEKL